MYDPCHIRTVNVISEAVHLSDIWTKAEDGAKRTGGQNLLTRRHLKKTWQKSAKEPRKKMSRDSKQPFTHLLDDEAGQEAYKIITYVLNLSNHLTLYHRLACLLKFP